MSMAKVLVSLPDELLAELDAEATRRGVSRSALLAVGARRELARRDSSRVAEAIERSERRFASAGRFEAAELISAERARRQ